MALGAQKGIELADLPTAIRGAQDSQISEQDSAELATTALADLERMTILRVFEQAGGDKAIAGKMLGISRATLYRRLKRYNIPLRSSHKSVVEHLG